MVMEIHSKLGPFEVGVNYNSAINNSGILYCIVFSPFILTEFYRKH